MSKATTVLDVHPDTLLEALLAKGGRSQRLGNLQKVHDICRRQHAGSQDFSISAIGRICEADGVLKGRALYNAASADYVSLISAWAAFQGVDKPKRQASPKPTAGSELLMRIEDPAVRSIMQATMVERDRLRAQLNLLKSQTVVTVDRRPLGATIVPGGDGQPVALLAMDAQLTDSEREALRYAISAQFLADQGWRPGTHGEILTEKGRTVFKVGYTRAIRKVLGES